MLRRPPAPQVSREQSAGQSSPRFRTTNESPLWIGLARAIAAAEGRLSVCITPPSELKPDLADPK